MTPNIRIADLAAQLEGIGLRLTWYTAGRCIVALQEPTPPIERPDGMIEFGPAVLDPLHAQQYAIQLFHIANEAAERRKALPGTTPPLPLFEAQEVRRG